MKTLLIILCAISLCRQAHAGEFTCDTDGSTMKGNVYRACGVGEAQLESQARLNAAKNAKDEFLINCEQCWSVYNISIEPKRTSCSQNAGQWKCYFLIVYTISEKKK